MEFLKYGMSLADGIFRGCAEVAIAEAAGLFGLDLGQGVSVPLRQPPP